MNDQFVPLLNTGTLVRLPAFSTGPRLEQEDWLDRVVEAGYRGIQSADAKQLEQAAAAGLLVAASVPRLETVEEIETRLRWASQFPIEALTVHLGHGFEDEQQAARLCGSLLEVSARLNLAVYVETHRSTLFQDCYRSLSLFEQFPQLRFNGDFSHWYTGCEMVYGDIDTKFRSIAPILRNVRFIHGRIGNPSAMQVAVDDVDAAHVQHFAFMWRESAAGFIHHQGSDPAHYLNRGRGRFYFAPELLPYPYARTLANGEEECDRWQQAQLLVELARRCFEEAAAQVAGLPAEG